MCVLVLGMHRSGTSAFARVLSLLGCDLPKTLLGAHTSNETGHWESQPVCLLNDRILDSAGSEWNDWLEFNPGWLQSPRAEEFREQAQAILQDEFGSSRLFILKDPRICRLVPFWLEVLKAAGARPLIIFPLRNPLEVSPSLEKRNGIEPRLGQLIWLRHVLDAEFASRGTPRFFTSYDRLLRGWARTAEDAQTTLGIVWPRMSTHVALEIEAYLSEKYRHHREPVEAVLDNPRLSTWLRSAYQLLGNWTITGERTEDFAALDRIKKEFNSAAPAFSRLVAIGQDKAQQARSMEEHLKEAQVQLRTVEAALAAEQNKTEFLQSELDKLTSLPLDEELRTPDQG